MSFKLDSAAKSQKKISFLYFFILDSGSCLLNSKFQLRGLASLWLDS